MIKKNETNKINTEFSYYSKLLKQPFDSIEELKEAEAAYNAKMKAKEDAASKKKADAQKVEDAFKALNAARKSYKEDLTQLTKEYAESLENLKKAFELGKKDIHNKLAAAEEAYSTALKEFTDKYDDSIEEGDTSIEELTDFSTSEYESEEQIENALKISCADEFIKGFDYTLQNLTDMLINRQGELFIATPSEKKLLQKYRLLDYEKKQLLFNMLDTLVQQQQKAPSVEGEGDSGTQKGTPSLQ